MQEPRGALDALVAPLEVALDRRGKHAEEPHRVGPVTLDQVVRIDDVLLRLRHLLHPADLDRTLAELALAVGDLLGEEVLDRLLNTFREKGYEGASLAELSAATGLVKASLYHYFPGGKQDMAEQVMAHLDRQLAAGLYAPLQSAQPPVKKLGAMLDAIDAFYEGGKKACLYERLCASVDQGPRPPRGDRAMNE